MAVKVDPNFVKELEDFGLKKDALKCFHCGNCTAVCPLSTEENPFPRRFVKYIQLGLKEKILKSPEPWLCYYCGDCSDRCPRGADPGETMMVLRRYLTSVYDWTGFSKKFYTSKSFEIMSIFFVAIFTGIALCLFHLPNPNLKHAAINSVWPAEAIEIADLTMAAVLTFFLITNAYRCAKFIMGDLLFKIPLNIYVSQAKEFIVHFFTQKRLRDCTDKRQWLIHFLIMTGYSTAFLLVVGFLAGGIKVIGLAWEPIKFQRDVIYPWFHPMRLFGYYATFALLYGTTYALIGRIKKSKAPYKNSHATDWTFLILLQLTTLTGIIVHFCRLLDLPIATYVFYVLHLMIAVPMLILEVPFAKWAHLVYRPLVIYLMKVKEEYERR